MLPNDYSGRITFADRPVLSTQTFEEKYKNKNYTPKKLNFNQSLKKFLNNFHPKYLINLFTILKLIATYDIKKYFISDLISGITVGILNVPTGLAYGSITTLNPIFGLYSTFFPSLIYIIFGTSKHLTIGTFAIVSIMVYSSIIKHEQKYLEMYSSGRHLTSGSFNSTGFDEELAQKIKLKIATSLAFWNGIVQVILSIFQFGYITKYLSQPLLKGFTTGASIHVLTAQVEHVFGIYSTKRDKSKLLKIFKVYNNILWRIPSANWISFAISISGIALILVVKFFINDKYKKQMKNIPFPTELVLIVAGILVSFYADLPGKFGIAIVGKIPSGIPTPSVPDLSLFLDVLPDAIIISIVGFATSISIADLYARKHKYKLNYNQEMFALGISNVGSSFFSCFSTSASLTRTIVQEESGGKTQLSALIANGVVLLCMFYLAPFLQLLPKACLGALIIASLVNLLKQVKDMVYYWKLNKFDFIVWFTTFLSALLFDIDWSLWIGLITLLVVNFYQNQKITLLELNQIENFEIFEDSERYVGNSNESFRVLKLTNSLNYANCDDLQVYLFDICPLKNTIKEQTLFQSCKQNYGKLFCLNGTVNPGSENKNAEISEQNEENLKNTSIILDFSLVHSIDEAAVKSLIDTVNIYKKENIKILISNSNDQIVDFLKKINVSCFFDEIMYMTIIDAIFSQKV